VVRLIGILLISVSLLMAGDEIVQPKTQYMVHLTGTRATWPDDMTPDEEKIMSEHFVYLKELTFEKKVILAGPCFGLKVGVIVLQTESEEEARRIMNHEPSVAKGLHKYEMYPMVVSLLTDYQSRERYPKEISDKVLRKEIVIPARRTEVWKAWTTTEGIKTFLTPEAKVELRIGGPMEVYFLLDAPGQRGSEGCRFLSFLPEEILSFEWNAPPHFGEIRKQHTQVIMIFSEILTDSTRIDFYQYGWGKGEKWDSLYSYFDRAWGNVLENLRKRFAEGPLDFKEE